MFVHLRVHSEFSLIDSTVRLEQLVAKTKRLGMPALGLSDELNLFALVKFVKAAESTGIKPLIGADCWLRDDAGSDVSSRGEPMRQRFTLFCQNQTGYLNLCRLLSQAWVERERSQSPAITWAALRQAHTGLIALSGGYLGDVGQLLGSGQVALARARAERWAELFEDRYYVEVSRCARATENELVPALALLAQELDLPIVATNDVRFLEASPAGGSDEEIDDYTAHEARVCIHDGYVLADANRPKRYTRAQYLKSPAEMAQLFADLPEALENTVELAKRCNFALQLGTYHFPKYPSNEDLPTDALMAREAREGLQQRLQELVRNDALSGSEADYQERLEIEIAVINRMGFAGYFLIVSEFIRWAKAHGIPVGPGRGSGAGSLVAYALLITDLDPIRYELLFERFLNPERVSMPDFDVDFCMDRRDEVIQHVSDLYGVEKVSQIITYGTMAAKACVRDAGRVLSMSYGHTDSIARLIPQTLGIELKDALAESAELRAMLERDDEARNLIDLALKLEGLTRNAGKHAGGVVIAPAPLTEFTPLYSEGHDRDSVGELAVTQFDKDDVEAIGLVKFDFLGLRTLTIIDWAIKAINTRLSLEKQAPLNLNALRTDDQATFALLQSGRTTAVFQLESRGMKELARKLKPNNFDDIIALGALFRPGPLQSGMVDEFVERKHGRREVVFAHPLLEPVLKATYGVIVYQEQVMQIAQVLAGYTLGGADMLRRAMGKKKPEEMAQQRAIFTGGASQNGLSDALATSIFDLMEKFAEYGFNKSHSAAYAMLSYQTAYLKAHYPAEFMAAVLSSEADNTDKIVDFLVDCREYRLTILGPDVNASLAAFSAQEGERTIRYGLSAIKGVGQAICAMIVAQRARGGPYRDLHDFVQRLSEARPNRRVLEALIDSGALDGLGPHRNALHANLGDALKAAERLSRDAQSGQTDMFGAVLRQLDRAPTTVDAPEASLGEKLAREKAVLGGYFSGHPLDELRAELDALGVLKIDGILARPTPRGRMAEQAVLVAGAVEALRKRDVGTFARLSDGSGGKLEAGFFREALERHSSLLTDSQLLLILGGLSWDGFTNSWQLKVRQAWAVEEALQRTCRGVQIALRGQPGCVGRLKALLQGFLGGPAKARVQLDLGDGSLQLDLGTTWGLRGGLEIKRALLELPFVQRVDLAFEASGLAE